MSDGTPEPTWRPAAVVLGCLLGILAVPVAAEEPARFERLIPRGRIAAISDPVFVPAAEADIDDDARVLAPHALLEGGHAAPLEDGQWVLLYRRPGAELSESTRAFVSGLGFDDQDGEWVDLATGARFEAERVRFVGGQVARLGGFDTFWYTWSLSHPDTTLLGQ
jgi:hypothetical protein